MAKQMTSNKELIRKVVVASIVEHFMIDYKLVTANSINNQCRLEYKGPASNYAAIHQLSIEWGAFI